MSENLERRLATSLRYGATQVRPVPVERLVGQPPHHARWRRLFERRLGESLRYGAAKARPGGEPLTVRPGPRQPWYRGRLVIAVAGLLAAVVLSAPLVLAQRHADHTRSALAGSGGSGPTTSAPPGDVPLLLTAGLYHDFDGTQPITGNEVAVDVGGFAFLIVRVQPAAPLGKTYLQRLVLGKWVTLGPHELDPSSRVAYVLRPTTTTTYRVYVPPADGHASAATGPVTVRIRG